MAGKSKRKALAWLCSGERPLPCRRLPTCVSACGGNARERCGVCLLRAVLPIIRVLPSWPDHFPKAHLLTPSPRGFLWILERHNIQTMAILPWNYTHKRLINLYWINEFVAIQEMNVSNNQVRFWIVTEILLQ